MTSDEHYLLPSANLHDATAKFAMTSRREEASPSPMPTILITVHLLNLPGESRPGPQERLIAATISKARDLRDTLDSAIKDYERQAY